MALKPVALLGLLLPLSAAQATCSADNGPVSCWSCASGADANVVSQLPRLNRAGKLVSSNLGTYAPSLFTCTANSSQMCSIKLDTSAMMGHFTAGTAAQDNTNIVNYAESIAFYAAFGFLCLLFCGLVTGCFCFCRSCCCCVRGGCCGKRYPSYSGNRGKCFCACCPGFNEIEALLIDDDKEKEKDKDGKDKDKDGKAAAPALSMTDRYQLGYGCSRWTVRVWMLIYVGLVAAFITMGEVKGNQGLTSSMVAMARSPSGIVSTIRSLQTPLKSFIVSASNDALVPLLKSVNSTVVGAIDLRRISVSTTCILDGVTNNLPDAAAIVGYIDDANATMATIKSTATGLQGQVGLLTTNLTSTRYITTQLSGNLTSLQSSLSSLNVQVANAQIGATAMDVYLTAMKDNTHGMPGIVTSLNSASTNMPTQAAADSARTGNSACLTALLAFSMDGNAGAADRTSLRTKLGDINTKITAMPNLNTLADDLAALNTKITQLRTSRLIDNLHRNISLIQATLNAMPAPASVNSLVYALQNSVNNINLQPIRGSLVTFNSTLSGGGSGSAFNFSGIIREVNKVDGLGSVIGCASTVVGEMENLLRSTLNSLPEMFSTVTDMITSVNTTFNSARAQAGSFRDTLSNLDSFGGQGFSLQTYINLIDSLQVQLQSSSIVDFTAVHTALSGATTSLAAFNLGTVLTNVVSLNTTIWDSSIMADSTSIANLRSLETILATMRTSVGAADTKLATFDTTLRCANTDTTCTVIASTAAPCSGGNPCTAAVRSCLADTTVTCTQNSDCSGVGGTCPFDSTIFTNAATSLQAFTAAGPDAITTSITGLSSSLTPASTTVSGVPALSTTFTQVTSFQTSLGNVLTPTIVNSVTSMSTQLDPNTLGLTTVNQAITDALASINGIDIAGIKQQMVSFDSSFGPMKATIQSTLKMVGDAVTAASGLFTTTLPLVIPRLSRASLNSKATLQAVVLEMADIVDTLLTTAKNATGGSSAFSLPISNVTAMVNDYLKYAEVITDPSYAQAGPLYFFTSFPGLGMKGVDAAVAGPSGTVFKDADGVAYPGGKKCYTDACMVNTIKQLNQKPIGEAFSVVTSAFGSSSGGSSTPLNVPLSREQIMALPYLIPLIIAFMGFLGAVGCVCGKKWQRVPACCSAFWICVVIPWLFLFAAVIFWPLIMIFSDTCRGATNLGYHFIKGSEGAVCNMLPGGSLGANGCKLSLQGQTINIPVASVYAALLGNCADNPTALSGVYGDLAKAASLIPGSFLNTTIDDFFANNASAPMGLSPKASLLSIPKVFGTNIGGAAKSLVTDFGDAFSCEVLNSDIARLTESVCCEALTSIYWYTSSFYLIALAMCFCGFPASILGYKRFPNVLWGPEYRKRLTQLGSLDAIVSGASGAVAASGSNSGRTGGTGNVVDEAMCAPAKWNKEGGTANPGSNSARITPMTGAAAQGSPVTEKTYNPTVNQPSPGAPLGSGGGTGVVMIAPRALSPSSNHPPGTYYNSPAPSTTTNASADSTPYNVASPPNYGNGQGVMMSPPSVGRPHFHGHQTPHHYAAVPQHASPNPALYQQGVGHRPSMSGGFALSPHRQQHQQLMQTPPPHIQNAGPYAPQPTQSAGYRG